MMTLIPTSTQPEAKGHDGAVSFNDRFDEVFLALKVDGDADPVASLAKCLEIARRVEVDCHADALPQAIDVLVNYGIDRERLMRLLLAVSQCGEARMLIHTLTAAQRITLLARNTEGEA